MINILPMIGLFIILANARHVNAQENKIESISSLEQYVFTGILAGSIQDDIHLEADDTTLLKRAILDEFGEDLIPNCWNVMVAQPEVKDILNWNKDELIRNNPEITLNLDSMILSDFKKRSRYCLKFATKPAELIFWAGLNNLSFLSSEIYDNYDKFQDPDTKKAASLYLARNGYQEMIDKELKTIELMTESLLKIEDDTIGYPKLKKIIDLIAYVNNVASLPTIRRISESKLQVFVQSHSPPVTIEEALIMIIPYKFNLAPDLPELDGIPYPQQFDFYFDLLSKNIRGNNIAVKPDGLRWPLR